ncbi:hypothetical protein CHARACLAT_021025, partial [Characodon lateralis]|nr:hypothetical protein [Characodon lateralis]
MELIKWAEQKFGGVTSFTTVQNLKTITRTEAQGTKPGSSNCVLENEDISQKPFLKTETEPKGIISCVPEPQNTSYDEIHVINIPEDSTVRNVYLQVKKQGTSLFLRGPQGTTWTFLRTDFWKLGSNNDIQVPQIQSKIERTYTGTLSGDKSEDVQKMALEYFKVSYFTSYSEITLNATTIFLGIGKQHNLPERSPTVKTAMDKNMIPITTNAPNQMPLTMALYTSPDYRLPLDPETRLQTNKRIYAEISGNTLGGMVLTLKVINCIVCSKASCSVRKELPFMLEACSVDSCQNSARLSFSLDQLQETTSTMWDLECSVNLCHSENCVEGGRVRRNLEVTQSCQPQ